MTAAAQLKVMMALTALGPVSWRQISNFKDSDLRICVIHLTENVSECLRDEVRHPHTPLWSLLRLWGNVYLVWSPWFFSSCVVDLSFLTPWSLDSRPTSGLESAFNVFTSPSSDLLEDFWFLKSKGLSDNALHDCFPLSRDMTAVSTRLATMTVIATLGPEGPLGLKTWYDIHIFHVSSYPWRL